MYRLLISGSRLWDAPEILQMVILQEWNNHPDLVVVHGDCPKGADKMARDFCYKHGIRQEKYPADWTRFGKTAGHIRNKAMVLTKPDKAIFFIRGESRGTRNCLGHAQKAGIPCEIYGEVR